jgi:hypothetical protein
MQTEINSYLRGTNYSLKKVSWNDVSRFKSDEGLSCYGSNITDVQLVGRNGESFYTVRGDNWNEKVGTVSTGEVAIINSVGGVLRPVILKKYLEENNISSPLDDKVSIRFQTTFLPISSDDDKVEFCTDSYSYNTPDPSNPKNLLLLCTTQGLTLHQNTNSHQKLFLHSRDTDGNLVNHWLEAEVTDYKVGSEQIETDEQVAKNMERGKASSSVIGIKSMGQRFNALLTVQIPLKQKEVTRTRGGGDLKSKYKGGVQLFGGGGGDLYQSDSYGDDGYSDHTVFEKSLKLQSSASYNQTRSFDTGLDLPKSGRHGLSSAGRLSRGSVASGSAKEVDVLKMTRSPTEHITITIMLYHVVKGGIPSKEDVIAAVTELDKLYSECTWSGTLKDISTHNVVPSTVDKSVLQKTTEELINRSFFPI